MQFAFFQLPVAGSCSMEEELNRFLRSHRVLTVQRELVREPGSVFWAFCVEYLPSAGGQAVSTGPSSAGKPDFKDLLSAEDFAVFAKLRKVRKDLAERDGVPVYAVFTNEQIAAIVTSRVASAADLRKINGVGEARVEKYGEVILQALREASDEEKTSSGSPT